MANLTSCSIGLLLKTECHQTTYTLKKDLQCFSNKSDEEKDLILLITEIRACDLNTICSHHNYYYLKVFETRERSCCNPSQVHKKSVKKSLRTISLDFAKALNSKGVHVKPGQKLCPQCRNFCEKKVKIDESSESDNDDPTVVLDDAVSRQQSIEDTNKSLDNLGCSPLKLHAISSHSKGSYGKRKLASVQAVLKQKVTRALDYPIESFDSDKEGQVLSQKAKDFDVMISLIKEKIVSVGRSKQIQILTLAPPSWSKEKIMAEFNVSEYLVRQARKLKKEKGILSIPDPRKGKLLSEETIKLVRDFYQNDEYSRILPGAKDKVSIKKNVYMQKRLILNNLRELFSCFKWENPNVKIGFSKFCTLRPKWCVLAGAGGTHSVCVCSLHQNVKLLLDAAQMEESYKDLIKFLVCDPENSNCMLRHCDKCPSNTSLIEFLEEKFDDFDPDDEIEYSQWVTTDRAELVKHSTTVADYVNVLVSKLQALIPHSFIARSQARALKSMKEHLTPEAAILLMDFSENYAFVIQNEIQSYHWARGGCTVHPVGMYLAHENGDKIISNHCFISDDLEHDTVFVNAVQREMMKWLTEHHPQVKKVHYFTDGCAAQYKNRKSFKNLCEHYNDFSIHAEHSFFATSHGKSICDGLGGTVKRILRKASLQQPDDSQIVTAAGVHTFCQTHIDNINFHFLGKNCNDLLRIKLEERFSKTRTVPGTRSYHHFKPLSSDSMEIRKVSDSEKISLFFTFNEDEDVCKWKCIRLTPNSYVAGVYDDKWYFALVKKVFDEEGDVDLLFLHPPGPAASFFWPHHEDSCFIPLEHILCTVSAPQTSSSGRVYYFSQEDIKVTEITWVKWLKHRATVATSI